MPTTKPVSPKDIVGTWTRGASRSMQVNKPVDYVLKLDLNPDGSFLQTITVSGDPNIIHQKGTWKINGGYLELSDALVEEWDQTTKTGKWKAEPTRFFIIDSYGGPTFAIFGGLFGDPDSWIGFDKIR